MAAESGIDKTVAGKEGVEGTIAEETPEALREQIKTLKKKVKFDKYFYPIAGAVLFLTMNGAFVYRLSDERPTKIYSISKVHNSVGDLDGNGVPDLVLEQNDGYLTTFFGHKFRNSITYVRSDEMEKLNPNSGVDYECIDNAVGQNWPIAWIGDEQKKRIDEEKKKLEEQGYPTGINCTKRSNSK